MSGIYTRKIIALALTFAYIVMSGYGMFASIEMPTGFELLVGTVIGWYFAKSTALEQPNDDLYEEVLKERSKVGS